MRRGRAGPVRRGAWCLPLVLAFLTASTATGGTLYVWTNGGHVAPYSTWETAATNITAAVSAGAYGDTVLITNGIYYEVASIQVTNGVTVCSVNGATSTVVNGNNDHQCFNVTHADAVLDGLTITRGKAVNGAGVTLYEGTIRNCIIVSNNATGPGWWDGNGGGVYLALGGIITNCMIWTNSARVYGGGVYCYADGTIADSLILNNIGGYGGGLYLYDGGMARNCVIVSNDATEGGGSYHRYGGVISDSRIERNHALRGAGVYLNDGGRVERSSISRNWAEWYGGGAMMFWDGAVVDCVLSNNDARSPYGSVTYGGGVLATPSGNVERCRILGNVADAGAGLNFGSGGTIRNSVLAQNWTRTNANRGGGAYISGATVMENCTVVYNTAREGAGIYCYETGVFRNLIVYWNDVFRSNDIGISYTYSCIDTQMPGVGNFTNNPVLADAAGGDYRLKGTSPCVDVGTNLSWMPGAADFEGHPRIFNGRVDVGADEACVTATGACESSNGVLSSWGVILDATCHLQTCTDLTSYVWENVGTAFTTATYAVSLTHTNPVPPACFYRLLWLRN